MAKPYSNGRLPRFDCFPRMLSQVCKPCIWEEALVGRATIPVEADPIPRRPEISLIYAIYYIEDELS